MPVSEQVVDGTFNAWWKHYGGSKESISKALDRTRRQFEGAMPPGYSPPPDRQRVHKCDAFNPIQGEFSPLGGQKPNHANAIPLIMGEDEIRKFMMDGRLERIEGIFLPSAIDEESESNIRRALEGLKRHSAIGTTKSMNEFRDLFAPEEQQYADPRLIAELQRQPCLNDPEKQRAQDLDVIRKFYGNRPTADVDHNFLEKLRNERVRKYLNDVNTIRKDPIAAGAYGLQRMVNDKGHEHAMKVAKAVSVATGLLGKTNQTQGWKGQTSGSRQNLQKGGSESIPDGSPQYSRHDNGAEIRGN
jgi:hypothetical protein